MTSDPGAGPEERDASPTEDTVEDTVEGTAEDSGSGTTADTAEQPRRRKRPFWRDLLVIVVAALVLTILLKAFVVQVFSIPSGSMENTLLPGDRILVSKIVYRFRDIHRGDIVVFSGAGSWDPPTKASSNPVVRVWDDLIGLVGIAAPGTDYVKRVIGLPGDHVVCCNPSGQVTVNGVALSESSYVFPGNVPSALKFSITVPAGRLWVMGDNRGDSDDSRYQRTYGGDGTVPVSAVVGRAFLIVWPLSRIGDLPIPNTFEQAALSTAAAVSAVPAGAAGGGAAVAAGAVLVWRRRNR